MATAVAPWHVDDSKKCRDAGHNKIQCLILQLFLGFLCTDCIQRTMNKFQPKFWKSFCLGIGSCRFRIGRLGLLHLLANKELFFCLVSQKKILKEFPNLQGLGCLLSLLLDSLGLPCTETLTSEGECTN